MAARADLFTAYAERRAVGDEVSCEQIGEPVAELDTELRAVGAPSWSSPRFSIVRHADHIYVLANGRVIEHGIHH